MFFFLTIFNITEVLYYKKFTLYYQYYCITKNVFVKRYSDYFFHCSLNAITYSKYMCEVFVHQRNIYYSNGVLSSKHT